MKRGLTLIEALPVFAMLAILAAAFISPYWFCPNRWKDSGLSAEFSFGTGCMVTRKDGTKVPEKAIRDVSL